MGERLHMMDNFEDAYELLKSPGLPLGPTSTQDEIARAFQVQSLRWHPDNNPGDAQALQMYQRLNRAYSTLLNPASRAAHHRHLQEAAKAPPAPPVDGEGIRIDRPIEPSPPQSRAARPASASVPGSPCVKRPLSASSTPPSTSRPLSGRLPSREPTGHAPFVAHFPRKFWLSRTSCLTPSTPVVEMSRFCAKHGFSFADLEGATPASKRLALYALLESQGWPDGHEDYLEALKQPQATKPRPMSARVRRYSEPTEAPAPLDANTERLVAQALERQWEARDALLGGCVGRCRGESRHTGRLPHSAGPRPREEPAEPRAAAGQHESAVVAQQQPREQPRVA